LHSQSLQNIAIGLLKSYDEVRLGGVPNLTAFPLLETFTMSALNLLETGVAHAHQKLQAPKLRVLTLQFSLEKGGRIRNFVPFKPEYAAWLKDFATLQATHSPHSNLETISIEHNIYDLRPYRSILEKPKPYPWEILERARRAVASSGGGKLKMSVSYKLKYSELEWNRAVRKKIMQVERAGFNSEDDMLERFVRHRRLAVEGERGSSFLWIA
jgi:hypothetical protein